jgi:hypothetical protein
MLSTIDGQSAEQYLRESADRLHGLTTTSMNCRIQRTSEPIGISTVRPAGCASRTNSVRGRSGRMGTNIGLRIGAESYRDSRLFQYPKDARLRPWEAQKSRCERPLDNWSSMWRCHVARRFWDSLVIKNPPFKSEGRIMKCKMIQDKMSIMERLRRRSLLGRRARG